MTNTPPTSGPAGWTFYCALAAALVGFGLFCDLAAHNGTSEPAASPAPFSTDFSERLAQPREIGRGEFSESKRAERMGRDLEQLAQVKKGP